MAPTFTFVFRSQPEPQFSPAYTRSSPLGALVISYLWDYLPNVILFSSYDSLMTETIHLVHCVAPRPSPIQDSIWFKYLGLNNNASPWEVGESQSLRKSA